MQDCPTFSLEDRYLLIYKVYVQRLLDAVWKYKDKALMFPACDIYSVSCFVITDTNHYTFSSFCSSTAASLVDIEWTPQHPRIIAPTSKRAVFTSFLLYCSPALKSVDQIQHPHTSAWPIRVRWGWSRDSGPWGQQPISVSGCVNKGCASASVGRLNGTLFMSTLGSFKEARRADIAESRFRKNKQTKKPCTNCSLSLTFEWGD